MSICRIEIFPNEILINTNSIIQNRIVSIQNEIIFDRFDSILINNSNFFYNNQI
jgi:hypothetical protein